MTVVVMAGHMKELKKIIEYGFNKIRSKILLCSFYRDKKEQESMLELDRHHSLLNGSLVMNNLSYKMV